MPYQIQMVCKSSLVLITSIANWRAVTSTRCIASLRALRQQNEENEKQATGMLTHLTSNITNALFLPDLHIVNNKKIEDLEKVIQAIETKYAAIEHMVEGLRQQVLQVSHSSNMLNSSYQGVQYNYTLQ